ncbi:MAG: alpha-galactosidase, partial [Alloprevotella sp.]|nr:alpha-galactosidase [Alloprevotella sp.]
MTFLKRTFLQALAIVSPFIAAAQGRHDLPPMMGWSSWNTYRVHISDSLICRQADLMVAKGLHRAGYTYINIDDGFQGGRAADG